MVSKASRIRLGFFLSIGILIFLGFVFLTIGRQYLEKSDAYFIEYSESISGLNVGNPVKMSGVEIGKVEDLSFSPDNASLILVKISVRKGVKIKADAEAVVEVFGITGLKYIDILKGSNEAATLLPGDKIKAGQSTIDMVTGRADEIARKVEIALNNIIGFTNNDNMENVGEAVVTARELMKNLNSLILQNKDNLNQFTGQLAKQGPDFLTRANGIMVRLDTVTSELDKLVTNKSLQKSMKNLETITDNIKSGLDQGQLDNTMKNVNRTLDNSSKAIQDFSKMVNSNKDRLNQILDRLENTARNLSDFTQKIKENPSLLIRKQEE
jgi:phospholipid/cholesterol/gamma-HCH transport system substrate-binding protein